MVEFIPEPFISSQDCQSQGGVWFDYKGCLLRVEAKFLESKDPQPETLAPAVSQR